MEEKLQDRLYGYVSLRSGAVSEEDMLRFPLEHYLQIQVVRYATEEINSNPNILPNISLGFQIYDSCVVLQRELEGTFWMLTGQEKALANFQCQGINRLAAFIGYSTSTNSMLMAHILGLSRYPQVSYFATSSLLSDRTQFPSFFRIVPSDAFQSMGLAQMVLHFGWMWIGLVAMDNEYGQQGIQVIRKELIKSGVCVEFTEYIQKTWPNNIPHIAQVIKRSTSNVVVVFSTDISFIPLLDEILKQNVSQKIWVASEAWAKSAFLSTSTYSSLLAGTLGFAFYGGDIPGFHEFIKHVSLTEPPGEAWYTMFLEEQIGCLLTDLQNFAFPRKKQSRNCTATDEIENFQVLLNNVSNKAILYNLYSAVHVIAHALHDMSSSKIGKGFFINGNCPDNWRFQPWQLLRYMKKINFTLSSGRDMFFDSNGNPPPAYDIVNWQMGPKSTMKQIKVGSYATSSPLDKILFINTSMIQWATGESKRQIPPSVCSKSCQPGFRKASIRGKPICCFECIPCPPGEISNEIDSLKCFTCPWNEWPSIHKNSCFPKYIEFLSYEEPLGITLSSTSVTSSMIPIAILGLLVYHRTSPAVKANNYTLSCLLLVSLSLCFLCSLAFIGYPHLEKCRLRQVTFGMVFALCISCILAKTVMVVLAFRATNPSSSLKTWAKPKVSYLVIGLGVFMQFLICICWLALSPPFQEYNSSYHSEVLVVECNEGSPTAFWGTLVYLGFLALNSFLVAFFARRLPGNFNEAKFITFSMLAFLIVWVSFIPASLSARGKYTVAMEIFAIQSSSWAIVCFMFAPKCYIILLHPNRNIKKHLMRHKYNSVWSSKGFKTLNTQTLPPITCLRDTGSYYMQRHGCSIGQTYRMRKIAMISRCLRYTLLEESEGMSTPGDIIIGGVLPIHVDKIYPKITYKEKPPPAICTEFRVENYQGIQAIRFAVDEINQDPDILPNITLGFDIHDSCTVLQRVVTGTLQVLAGLGQPVPNYRCQQDVPLAALIGHSVSTYSMQIAHILGLYRYPQISYYSTSSLLSDRTQFKSFFRTVPSDAFQTRGLAQLVLHFGWTWVGLVALGDDYGQQGIQLIKRDILRAGACVAFTENIMINRQDRNAPYIARVIKESTAKVVVFFTTDVDLIHVLEEMLKQNVSGKIWVASESWANTPMLDKYSSLLSGTIGFTFYRGTIPGFKDFLNGVQPSMSLGREWNKIFWEQAFNCKFLDDTNLTVNTDLSIEECTGSENLHTLQTNYNDVSNLRVTYNIYTAVHVIAKALHDLNTASYRCAHSARCMIMFYR
ncbi:extracellular calcium-sensing receptor-like, partial [Pelobates cultripes]